MSNKYGSKLESINKNITKLIEENKSNISTSSNFYTTFKELKSEFSNKFSQTITDLEFIISKINNLPNNCNFDQNNLDEEESPASIKPKIIWPNNEYIWTHEIDNNNITITSKIPLESSFSVSIRILKLKSTNHATIGVSNREIDGEIGSYLGVSCGKGNWGIAGCGTLGEEGSSKTVKTLFKEGDILTITGVNGLISYRVKDEDNSSYQYDMKTTHLFLGASMYYKGDQLEIIV